jgi:glycosyltransferase involved in cell wall biosynthesis
VTAIDDPRITYLKQDRNSGAGRARNTGISHARGEYIAFQDSDDEWVADKLSAQMGIISNAPADVGVVYTGYWRIIGDHKVYLPPDYVSPKEGDILAALLRGNFITTQTALIRKACFEKAGVFDNDLPRLQDWELWIRIAKHYLFRYIPKPLVLTYYQKESITAHHDALIRAFELILRKHRDDFERDKNVLAQAYFTVGSHLLFAQAQTPQEKTYLRRAFRLNPFCMTYLFYAVLSLIDTDTFSMGRTVYRKIKKLMGYPPPGGSPKRGK